MEPTPIRDTLNHHILRHQKGLGTRTRGEFSGLLMQVASACKWIASECRRAGLGDAKGSTGSVGHHGDEVHRLDAFADAAFARAFDHTALAAAVVSEEMEEPYYPAGNEDGKADYVVCIDPIDGSGNIEVDVTVGTIFSVQKRAAANRAPVLKDLLRAGTHLEAAGYVLYGPACVMVLATGLGVDVCTQDPVTGEFLVTDTKVQVPSRGPAYSVNEANDSKWDEKVRRLVGRLRAGEVGEMRTSRYVGSLVADFHRTLLRGGLFCYPGEAKKPEGKIRLLYEAAPLAFIAEKAGGAASTGKGRILEVVPKDVHERTPVFLGGSDDVADAVRILGGG